MGLSFEMRLISFKAAALNQKHIRNVCHTAHLHLTKFLLIAFKFQRNKLKCNFHYEAMPMMTSQILRSVDFTKSQRPRYLENNKTLFSLQIKKIINYKSKATL